MPHSANKALFSRNVTSGWLLLALEVLVAFALTPYIINSLGVAGYGIFSLLFSLIGYMGLIDIGIRGSVGRYINHYIALRDRRRLDEVVGTATIALTALGAAAIAGTFVLAAFFSNIFPKTPEELIKPAQDALPLLGIGLWLSFVGSIFGNLVAAKEYIYLTNYLGVASLATRTAGSVWVLSAGHGLEGLVAVTIGINAANTIATLIIARVVYGREMPAVWSYSSERLKEMWRFGVASFVSRTASTMATDSGPLIGMWLLGPEAVAIYSVALTLTQYSRRLIDQTNSAIFPSVMKSGATRDFVALRAIYIRYMNLSFAVGSLVFIGVIVFSTSFLTLWVGAQYAPGGIVAAILASGYLLQSIASTGPLSLASLDRVDITMKISLAEAAGCIILSLLLPSVFGLGLIGLALGATLPRLVFGCAVYPWLSVATLGPELKAEMWEDLRYNLAMCVMVAAFFGVTLFVLGGETWLSLVAAVAAITAVHLATLGHRYEIVQAARFHYWLKDLLLPRIGKR